MATDAEVSVSANQWQIYPNPTQGKVWLEGPAGTGLVSIHLYDYLGRMLLTQEGTANNKQLIDLPGYLSAGIYFLVLEQSNGNRQTLKLIVKP
jgi:hypothetical protein